MTRLFADFPEAQNEITRDLAELGVNVQPETMQDRYVANNPQFLTKELMNYSYSVLNPQYDEIEGVHAEWVQQEWEDRLIGELNPGRAWKLRPDVWEQFLEKDFGEADHGSRLVQFSYTYSRRMGGKHIKKIIEELQTHPHSRQLWLPVWWPIDADRRGERRVPCSLGYWLVQRSGALHMTYVMRSCDFYTHYANDVALATMLLHFISKNTDLDLGTFTHFVGSLHVYAKDVEDVF